MLDVHPPHHPAQGWRDFFVHIATIVVGLLIAVGLEQTVEAIHRHRERVELEELLYRQAEENSKAPDISRVSWEDRARWLTACIGLIKNTPAVGGSVTVTLPTQGNVDSQPSQRSAWTLARSNGTLPLLPGFEQEICERVDWIAEQEELGFQRFLQVRLEVDAAEREVGVVIAPGTTIHFPAAQREQLVHELSKGQVAVDEEASALANSEAFDTAVFDRPRSEEQLRSLVERHWKAMNSH